jgi:hypothetical protein
MSLGLPLVLIGHPAKRALGPETGSIRAERQRTMTAPPPAGEEQPAAAARRELRSPEAIDPGR